MARLGLYLHIPFCVQKCRYCDFHSAKVDKGARTVYVRALCKHLETLAPTARDMTVDTVYFGGGTPTLLETADFKAILDTVKGYFLLEREAEITAEEEAKILAQRNKRLEAAKAENDKFTLTDFDNLLINLIIFIINITNDFFN